MLNLPRRFWIVQISAAHGTIDSFRHRRHADAVPQNGYLPFNEAICKTFGVDGDIRAVVPDGNTDPLIVEDIFVRWPIDNFQFRDAANGRLHRKFRATLPRSLV